MLDTYQTYRDYCIWRDRYDKSDGKQGQTNSWGVDIVIDHVMPYLQYSSSASKERMEAAGLQSGMWLRILQSASLWQNRSFSAGF